MRSKGKTSPSVPAQPPVNTSVPAATSEWDSIPEPVAQPPPVSYVPEPITQVPQESYNNEEGELHLIFFLFSIKDFTTFVGFWMCSKSNYVLHLKNNNETTKMTCVFEE